MRLGAFGIRAKHSVYTSVALCSHIFMAVGSYQSQLNTTETSLSELYEAISTRTSVVHIGNKYGCVVVWISFEDSLRLFIVSCIELAMS